MNKIFGLILCLLLTTTMYSQIHEVGVFLGGSNYIGDIGPTTYIAPNEPAFGVLYKWNKSPRHAYRFSYTQSKLTSNDKDSKEPSRNQRGYDFENSLKEVSLALEFNFFDFNLHQLGRKVTPYISSGISYFMSNYTLTKPRTYMAGRIERKGKTNSIAIPTTLGIKLNISPQIIIAAETGVRYSFTDNIDGSYNDRFGNINNNDWYVFSGATLTYTFGEKPCYCLE